MTQGFQKWLEQAITAESNSKVRWEKIDPYVTSTRSAEFVAGGLLAIRDGQLESISGRPQQRLTDLNGASLAGGTVTAPTLTPLGTALHAVWNKYGILDLAPAEAKRYEFPRNLLLVETALDMRVPQYLEWFQRWKELRADRPAEEWLNDPWGLTLAAYLRVPHGNYNPYRVLLAAGCPPWLHKRDLEDWGSLMPVPDGWVKSRLSVLLSERVHDTATRANAKITFCRAMEAACLKRDGVPVSQLKKKFQSWEVPDA